MREISNISEKILLAYEATAIEVVRYVLSVICTGKQELQVF